MIYLIRTIKNICIKWKIFVTYNEQTLFYTCFLFVAVLLSSCEKKDTSIILPPKGNGTAMQVDMGENYDYQYFISLQQNSIVHISPTKNWDLAFSCDPNSHAIF